LHRHLHHPLDLKKSPQPPDLKDGLADDNSDDEQVPPLDAAIGAFGGVAVGSLAQDDVGLLVLDRVEEIGQVADFAANWLAMENS
jgi:hypothetical protein